MTLAEMHEKVKVGDKITIKNHPSGRRFDGVATVVNYWWNSFYFGINVISDKDHAKRWVSQTLGTRKPITSLGVV
jgi:hypothetical protein